MNTPVYDFLRKYAGSQTLRMHMPGHKGVSAAEELHGAYALDITEITGADSLFEAEGIIAESEKNASSLFGTEETVYSCGGSTLCIQAMLYLMKQENRRVIAGRTVHRAFLNACILLGLQVTWVYPHEEDGILSGKYDPADFEKALAGLNGESGCVYITSPDYTGNMQDIAAISEICRKYDAPLLVDNAHGAHLAFTEERLHPMQLGADLCCDSAHKVLPCLTGCAYLHTSNPRYKGRLKNAMSMFGSTSPSYLMLCSLDLCNVFLEDQCRKKLREISADAEELKSSLEGKYIFRKNGDPLHITIDTAAMGWDGRRLGEQLEAMGCYPEYAGREAVVLLLSAAEPWEDILLLEAALGGCEPVPDSGQAEKPPAFPRPMQAMDMREAALSSSEMVPVREAEGRICAGVKVPCPPAVPVVISGEVIDRSVIETLEFYGIDDVMAVTERRQSFIM
ncbi:MAG: aminotransferase class V-fold PLP-dependent enzyme [Oscillospiraceae bacterium]|nr:aminotransferase class V-fold PLP-dependent enzyme [Oscillospiraceae bacterium]